MKKYIVRGLKEIEKPSIKGFRAIRINSSNFVDRSFRLQTHRNTKDKEKDDTYPV